MHLIPRCSNFLVSFNSTLTSPLISSLPVYMGNFIFSPLPVRTLKYCWFGLESSITSTLTEPFNPPKNDVTLSYVILLLP